MLMEEVLKIAAGEVGYLEKKTLKRKRKPRQFCRGFLLSMEEI